MFEQYTHQNINNIFIIRSSSRLFPLVIDELKKTFPTARFSCLTTNEKVNQRSPLQYDVDHVVTTLHAGGFQWRDIPHVHRMLRSHAFDLAVVLYNSEKGYSYLNVDTFAFSVRPKCIVNVNIKKNVTPMTKYTIIYKAFHRIIDIVWASFNMVITVFVLIIIFLTMVLSAPFMIFKNVIRKR